jgi:hypothetical protein
LLAIDFAMKITFSNLGTIKKTALDLRRLTVIIGPNNASKTYVAYTTYGLWKSPNPSLATHLPDILLLRFRKIGDNLTLRINADFIARVTDLLKQFHVDFQERLETHFQDSSHRIFLKTKLDVQIEPKEVLAAVKQAVSSQFPGWTFRNEIVTIPMGSGSEQERSTRDREYLSGRFVGATANCLFPDPLLLPAERNAFVTTYKMLATRRFRILREGQRGLFDHKRSGSQRQLDLMREQGDVRYPIPIEDFLDFLTDVELSEDLDLRLGERNPFRDLANDIEDKIQGKNKTRLTATKLGGREIKVDVKKGLSIDLYNASSSIKQLAPLLLYLRYRAKENGFLIIDEPEMNLHPESQAKLLEALAILVNLGVRVLLTTHSPYFMAHLNNLVAGAVDPEIRKKQAASLYLGDERAFLPMDDVSAYEMKDGQLSSLKDEDYGIRWDTLSDVSAELQQRFFAIQEEGHAGRGKKK